MLIVTRSKKVRLKSGILASQGLHDAAIKVKFRMEEHTIVNPDQMPNFRLIGQWVGRD